MTTLTLSLVLSALFGAAGAHQCPSPSSATAVSMIELISRPEEYAGKHVVVIGYIVGTARRFYLFLDKGTSGRADYANSVLLGNGSDWTESRDDTDSVPQIATIDRVIAQSYNIVSGKFEFNDRTGRYFSYICDIRGINMAPADKRG